LSIFLCWVLFPLLFCALALGSGLLVERVAGAPIRGVLLLPVGFASIVVASQVTTYWGATTFLATPLVVALAVAGYILGRRRLWPTAYGLRPTPYGLWPVATGLGVFATYAAPVVLTGSATFLGYTLLGDTAVHFSLIDWVMKHGHSAVPGGGPSSLHAALASYIATAYPLGAHTALGAMRPLMGQDVAWIYQPYLAVIAAFTALCIYAVLARAVAQRWLLALAAFLAAQPGLVYAYALEGSIKEMATICLIAMLVAVGADYVARRGGLRAVVPLALVTAAGVGVLNASILPWLAPILVAVLVALVVARGAHAWRAVALEAALFCAVAALLSYPSLAVVGNFIHSTTASLTSGTEFGNLLGRLNGWQALGIWPVGDFRLQLTDNVALGYALLGLEAVAIALGVLWAVRRAAGWPLVFMAASLIGWGYITARSNAWGDAKALMILSPAVVAAAMLGPPSLWGARRRVEATLLAAAIAAGVLWTNALAYHDADLAPRNRLAELARIGERFAGQGPALYTEFEEFNKHFLRQLDPTGSNESWQDNPRASLATGGSTRFGFSSDIDELASPYVQRFRMLVLRRSGSASRPPSDYRLVFEGRFYDVWRKDPAAPVVVRHVGLGSPPVQPASVPSCSRLRTLAAAGGGSRLAFVQRPDLPVLFPADAKHPRLWFPDGADPTNLRPYGRGVLTGTIRVAQAARYTVWVEGSFGRGYSVSVDGHPIGSVRNELNPRGEFDAAGATALSPGLHTIQLVRPGGSLYPGDGGRNRLLGPIVLDPATDARVVQELPLSRWHELCGMRLDWVETIR
jgi:hypothetical protein